MLMTKITMRYCTIEVELLRQDHLTSPDLLQGHRIMLLTGSNHLSDAMFFYPEYICNQIEQEIQADHCIIDSIEYDIL